MKIITSILLVLMIMEPISTAGAVSHLMRGEPDPQDTSQDAAWIKWLENSMVIISNDVTMLSGNISQKDKGELATELEMIWDDLDIQQAALKTHPAPKKLASAESDYSAALGWLRSSVINFESFVLGRNAPVISLGSNPTQKGQPDNIANGLSNLNSCKMYLARIPNDINLTEGDN